jgi:NADPH2:quinone reductase
MKAWSVSKVGSPKDVMELIDKASPVPAPGVIKVKVLTSGIGLPDVLMCKDDYPFTPPRPYTGGQELCGIIIDANGREGFKNGQRVMAVSAFTQGDGSFAEEALITSPNVFPAPDYISDVDAAVFNIPYRTGYVGLVLRGQMQKGETLLVFGASGGTGFAAIQLAKALGGKVIAVANGKKKSEKCLEFGADEIVDSSREDFVERAMAFTNGKGVDLVFDPVGGEIARRAVNCMGFGSRLIAIGFASGSWGDIPAETLALKNLSLVGALANVPTQEMSLNMQEALYTLYREGKIKPVIERELSFEEIPQAMDDLENRRVSGKLVVVMNS